MDVQKGGFYVQKFLNLVLSTRHADERFDHKLRFSCVEDCVCTMEIENHRTSTSSIQSRLWRSYLLRCQLGLNSPTCLMLHDTRSGLDQPGSHNIRNLERYQITGNVTWNLSPISVRQSTSVLCNFEPCSNSPDLLLLQWSLMTDDSALIPCNTFFHDDLPLF